MLGCTAPKLARIQYGFTIFFDIVSAAIAIGLAVLEGCWVKSNNTVYQDLYRYWAKIIAINFGAGVVFSLPARLVCSDLGIQRIGVRRRGCFHVHMMRFARLAV